jgi:hypothetical protein
MTPLEPRSACGDPEFGIYRSREGRAAGCQSRPIGFCANSYERQSVFLTAKGANHILVEYGTSMTS